MYPANRYILSEISVKSLRYRTNLSVSFCFVAGTDCTGAVADDYNTCVRLDSGSAVRYCCSYTQYMQHLIDSRDPIEDTELVTANTDAAGMSRYFRPDQKNKVCGNANTRVKNAPYALKFLGL